MNILLIDDELLARQTDSELQKASSSLELVANPGGGITARVDFVNQQISD